MPRKQSTSDDTTLTAEECKALHDSLANGTPHDNFGGLMMYDPELLETPSKGYRKPTQLEREQHAMATPAVEGEGA